MNKKHGWVLQENGDGGFVDEDQGSFQHASGTKGLQNPVGIARIYATRKLARESDNKLGSDTIRKVELDENGVAVKVIPGR